MRDDSEKLKIILCLCGGAAIGRWLLGPMGPLFGFAATAIFLWALNHDRHGAKLRGHLNTLGGLSVLAIVAMMFAALIGGLPGSSSRHFNAERSWSRP